MHLCLIITIDRARSTLLVTVNTRTVRTCVYFAANVGKLSYLLIILMGHKMVVNVQYISGASPGFGRWGAKIFYFRLGNLHVAKRHAAHGEAMRIVWGVRGHALPRKNFKRMQFGAF